MTIHNIINKAQKLLQENKGEIFTHLLGWGVFYLIDFLFVIGIREDVGGQFVLVFLSTIFYFVLCFYTIVSVYVKYLPQKRIHAGLIALALILTFSLINVLWDVFVIKYQRSLEGYDNSFYSLYLLELWRFSTSALYAFAYWIYLQRIKEQKLRVQTEKQLHKAELDFLKAQINPHFLFNTLNFVYGDVVSKSERAGSAILGLTNLLRYTVESTKSEQSNLKKEVDAIEEFLKLQRVRFGKRVNVTFTKNGLFPFFAMPPLVLMSLVENAFKYGVLDDPENPIEISLDVEKEGLQFGCINKVRQDFTDKETTAVGIANIKRRLDLVYKENYDLIVNNSGDIYEVILTVSWKS